MNNMRRNLLSMGITRNETMGWSAAANSEQDSSEDGKQTGKELRDKRQWNHPS